MENTNPPQEQETPTHTKSEHTLVVINLAGLPGIGKSTLFNNMMEYWEGPSAITQSDS